MSVRVWRLACAPSSATSTGALARTTALRRVSAAAAAVVASTMHSASSCAEAAPAEPAAADPSKSLTSETMSQHLRAMQYAVRGDVVMRAEQIQQQLLRGDGAALPFDKITFANIGNPLAVGQRPITFFRQVLALCDLPNDIGIDHPHASLLFPADAIERARAMKLAMGPGDTGAYSTTQGVLRFRQDVAEFISERDGHPCSPADIYLANGASSAIRMIMNCVISGPDDAVLVPIPQYPIYSGLLSLFGAHQAGYELDEANDWAVSEARLQRAVDDARAAGKRPRACVMINPGNPTGNVFTLETLQAIVRFCVRERLVLLADEVYQENVYDDALTFRAVRKVAIEMGAEAAPLELFSFHSTSKGLLGECGKRGGYVECMGIDPYVQSQIFKLASSALCAALPGQALTSLMVKPPAPGDASYALYAAETTKIKSELKAKARLLVDGLRTIPGFACNDAKGAMYAFPSVELPPKAVAEARAKGQEVSASGGGRRRPRGEPGRAARARWTSSPPCSLSPRTDPLRCLALPCPRPPPRSALVPSRARALALSL
jgi:alanine transaminase